MSNTHNVAEQPLGAVLQQAGLVSEKQVKAALEEQKSTRYRIGEILAAHGWIAQESADFFAEEWPQLKHQASRQKLGQYLRRAALLKDAQVESILAAQQQRGLKFGTLAVLNGWVRHQTVDFFLRYMSQPQTRPIGHQTLVRNASPEREMLRSRLSQSKTVNPFALLLLYQQILQQGTVQADGSPEQAELLNTGLAFVEQNRLKLFRDSVPPSIDQSTVDQELGLRPYDRIRLRLLKLESCSDRPYQVLAEVLAWTGNQPDLTQKLCQVIRATGLFIPAGEEAAQVANLVHSHFIQNWESSGTSEPLRKLRDRILNNQQNQHCPPLVLLQFYERLLKRHEIRAAGSQEEQELLELGLITRNKGALRVANKIYRFVFNYHWVAQAIHAAANRELKRSEFPIQNALPQSTPTARLNPSKTLLAGEDAPFSPTPGTTIKRSRIGSSLGLCIAIAGTALIGVQFWRQISHQISITLSPPSPLTNEIPDPDIFPQSRKNNAPQSQKNNAKLFPQNHYSKSLPIKKTRSQLAQDDKISAPADQSIPKASADPTLTIPIFITGSNQTQILKSLGLPTWNRQGYYPNSRALLYKGIVSKHVDLGYLLDSTTGRLRQTEIAFDQSISLDTVQKALRQLLKGTLPATIQRQLREIYQRRITRYNFAFKPWEGEIHRDPKGWIYIGIWDADFH
jgi:hypothetical protein